MGNKSSSNRMNRSSNLVQTKMVLHTGEEVYVEINSTISTETLIQLIREKRPDIEAPFILIFREKVLESRYTLKDYGISEGDEIRICPAIQGDEMEVTFRDDAKIYPLKVSRNWTVSYLTMILQEFGVLQRNSTALRFEGRLLDESKTLQECGLYSGCRIKVDKY